MQSHKLLNLLATLIAIGHIGSAAVLNCVGSAPGSSIQCSGTNIEVKCFVKIEDDGSVTRGCDINNSCNPPNCLACTTDNCNNALVCKQCNGNEAECATTNAATQAYNRLCKFGDVCVNTVNQNGTMFRGCAATEVCGSNAATCQTCANDVCNVGIFPKNRRQCYQCKGDSCSTLNANLLKPCAVYQAESQKCYTYATSPTDIQRGCQTDLDESNKCGVDTTNPNCSFCDNEDGCNNAPYQQELGSCYKCSDNEKCVGEQSGDSSKCPQSTNTQAAQSCYTQSFPNGTVARGCTNELQSGCNASENCIECSGNNCNNKEQSFSCIVCRSDYYEPCRDALYGTKECPESSLSGPDAFKCFSGEWDGIVIRGCLSDATSLMKYQCNDDKDNRCEVCTTDGCNTKLYNGATVNQLHLDMALVGAVIVMLRQYM